MWNLLYSAEQKLELTVCLLLFSDCQPIFRHHALVLFVSIVQYAYTCNHKPSFCVFSLVHEWRQFDIKPYYFYKHDNVTRQVWYLVCREISEAQDKFTNLLQKIYLEQPNDREIVRLIMGCVGRGGEGNSGQRIRDEILVLQVHHLIIMI